MEKSSGRTTRAWMTRPTITERVYIPNWLPISARSLISKIFPVIRNRMPTGVYLRGEGKVCQEDITDRDRIIQIH